MSLQGKTAVITGATRGIGRAIALNLADHGVNIAFNYRSNTELALSLEKDIQKRGVSAKSYQTDISDYDNVQQMKKDILTDFDTVDIVINNAGIIKDSSLVMMNKASWSDVIDTNLNGTFNVSKAFIITLLKQKHGNIVNLTSYSGVHGMAGQSNYAASKGAIIAFTKSLAKEGAAYNVRVNAVAPGFIETDMLQELNQEYLKTATQAVPLGRLGTAAEVANVVNFLISDRSAYITGQTIQIDGGLGM